MSYFPAQRPSIIFAGPRRFARQVRRVGGGKLKNEQFRPRVVSFYFGLPSAELLARVRSGGRRSSPRRPRWKRPAGGQRGGTAAAPPRL